MQPPLHRLAGQLMRRFTQRRKALGARRSVVIQDPLSIPRTKRTAVSLSIQQAGGWLSNRPISEEKGS